MKLALILCYGLGCSLVPVQFLGGWHLLFISGSTPFTTVCAFILNPYISRRKIAAILILVDLQALLIQQNGMKRSPTYQVRRLQLVLL